MKLAFGSDFHVEVWHTWECGKFDCDVLVLAGDIARGGNIIKGIRGNVTKITPIVQIAGNHESYGFDWLQTLYNMETDAIYDKNTHFLERSSVVINGVRFLGCTLWTDYCLYGDDVQSIRIAVSQAERYMADFRRISYGGGKFTPAIAKRLHEESLAWLEYELSIPFNGPTVVVTHHTPSSKSCSLKYEDDPLNSSFHSNLDWLVEKYRPTVWIHGHTHDPFDYMLYDTRVLCHPRGYPNELTSEDVFTPKIIDVTRMTL